MRINYLILITAILIVGCNNKKPETITVKHQTSITNPEISLELEEIVVCVKLQSKKLLYLLME